MRLLGEIKAQEDPRLEEADAAFTQSMVLGGALSMRPLVAHCHAGLARVQWRIGTHTKAEEHFQIATRSFQEMGMTFWEERAGRAWQQR